MQIFFLRMTRGSSKYLQASEIAEKLGFAPMSKALSKNIFAHLEVLKCKGASAGIMQEVRIESGQECGMGYFRDVRN